MLTQIKIINLIMNMLRLPLDANIEPSLFHLLPYLKYLYQKERQIANKCLMLENAKYFFFALTPQLSINI